MSGETFGALTAHIVPRLTVEETVQEYIQPGTIWVWLALDVKQANEPSGEPVIRAELGMLRTRLSGRPEVVALAINHCARFDTERVEFASEAQRDKVFDGILRIVREIFDGSGIHIAYVRFPGSAEFETAGAFTEAKIANARIFKET